MKEALNAIRNFADENAMFAYCDKAGVRYDSREPPYLTMARIADSAVKQEITQEK